MKTPTTFPYPAQNGGLVQVDVARVGEPGTRWPNHPFLAGRLTNAIFELIWTMSAERPDSDVRLLMARIRIGSMLGVAISAYQVARACGDDAVPARLDGPVRLKVDADPINDQIALQLSLGQRAKRWLAVQGQCLALRLIDLLGLPRPTIMVSDYPPNPDAGLGWRWRVRSPFAFFNRGRVSPDEVKRLRPVADEFTARVAAIAHKLNAPLDEAAIASMPAFTLDEMAKSLADYTYFRRLFGNRPINFYGGTVTAYSRAIIALAARAAGGRAHCTLHGGMTGGTRMHGGLTELVIADHMWVPTPALVPRAERTATYLPPQVPRATIKALPGANELKAMVGRTAPTRPIHHVAIMGVPLCIASAVWTAEFACYLAVERRLAKLLLDAGYAVTFKAHPEDAFRDYEAALPAGVAVEWRGYERVCHAFDASIHLLHPSTTLISDLGSDRHVFLLTDGYHEAHWLPEVWETLSARCNLMPARVGEDNWLHVDERALLESLQAPKMADMTAVDRYIGA